MTDPRVAIVTGGATGIGMAVVERLISAGYRVAVLDIDGEALSGAWGGKGSDVLPIACDVSDNDAVDSAVAQVQARFGRLDAVVNNAALHGPQWSKPCLSYSSADWTKVFQVNVYGIANLARASVPLLQSTKGVIVNMSSNSSYGFGASPYSVSKAAVNGLTTALAAELGPLGIRVVGVAPGLVKTPSVLSALPPGSEAALAAVLASQAIDVESTPDDIAAVIEFLISPAARLITAHTVLADAGMTRRP